QHGVEAGNETSYLAGSLAFRPQIVAFAVAHALGDGRKFLDRTRDLASDDENEAKRHKPDERGGGEIEGHAPIEAIHSKLEEVIQFYGSLPPIVLHCCNGVTKHSGKLGWRHFG